MLCFGAGGSAVATLLHLMNKTNPGDRPRRFVMVNRSQGTAGPAPASMVSKAQDRISSRVHLQRRSAGQRRDYGAHAAVQHRDQRHRHGQRHPRLAGHRAGPVPGDGIAWEFNYRGELDFLHQAEAQRETRELQVEDGWLYFLHGWTQVVAQVLHFPLTPELLLRLKTAAETVR